MSIDVAIAGGRNVIKKAAGKIIKNEDPTTEVQHMWNVKIKVIAAIAAATGTTSKSFWQYLRNITGKHEIKELQKTATFGTAHILQKVLMKTYKTYDMGNSIICTIIESTEYMQHYIP